MACNNQQNLMNFLDCYCWDCVKLRMKLDRIRRRDYKSRDYEFLDPDRLKTGELRRLSDMYGIQIDLLAEITKYSPRLRFEMRLKLNNYKGIYDGPFYDDMDLIESRKPYRLMNQTDEVDWLDLDYNRTKVLMRSSSWAGRDHLYVFANNYSYLDVIPENEPLDTEDTREYKQEQRRAIRAKLDRMCAPLEEKYRIRMEKEKRHKLKRKIEFARLKSELRRIGKQDKDQMINHSLITALGESNPFTFFLNLVEGVWNGIKGFGSNLVAQFGGLLAKIAVTALDKVGEHYRAVYEETFNKIVSKISANLAAFGLFIMNLCISEIKFSTLMISISNLLLHLDPSLGTKFCNAVSNAITQAPATEMENHGGLSQNFVHGMLTGVTGLKLPLQLFKDLTNKLKLVSSFKKGIADAYSMLNYFTLALEKLRIWYYGKVLNETIDGVDVPEFITGVFDLTHMGPKELREPANLELVRDVNKAAARIARALIGKEQKGQAFLSFLLNKVISFNQANYVLLGSIPQVNRPAPYMIYLTGDPGVGKTSILPMFFRALMDPRNAPPTTRPYDLNRLIYRERTTTKYDDAYQNEPVWIIDDIFQYVSNEMTTPEMSEASKVIEHGSPGEKEVADSRAGNKGRNCRADVVGLTSNALCPDCPEVRDIRAVHRRVKYKTYVSRKPNSSGPLTPDSMEFRRIPSVLAVHANDTFVPLKDEDEWNGKIATDGNVSTTKIRKYFKTFPTMKFSEWVKDVAKDWNAYATSATLDAFSQEPSEDCYLTPEEKEQCQGPYRQPLVVDEPYEIEAGEIFHDSMQNHSGNDWTEELCRYIRGINWIGAGAVMLTCLTIFGLLKMVVKTTQALVHAGAYDKEPRDQLKQRLKVGPKPRAMMDLHGNSVNTLNKIKDMCVHMEVTINGKTHDNCGLAYCGKFILTNFHFGQYLLTEEYVDLRIESAQRSVTIHPVKWSNVYYDQTLEEDWCILYIDTLRMYPDNTHLFMDEPQLPSSSTNVIAYSRKEDMAYHSGCQRMRVRVPCDLFAYDYVDWYKTPPNLTLKGDCGSPLIESTTGRIIGIFGARYREDGVFIPVWKSKLPKGPHAYCLPVDEPMQYAEIHGHVVDAQHKNIVMRASSLRKAPLYGLFEVRKQPAYLKADHPNGDPLETGFKKNFEPSKPLPVDALEIASDINGKQYALMKKPLGIRALTDDEVLNGKPGVFKGIDLSTSLGVPFKHKTQERGKYGLIDMVNGTRVWKDNENVCEFKKKVALMEEDLVKGNVPLAFCTEQLKDEPVKIEKVKLGKTRTFRTPCFEINYLMRKYFGAFAAAAEHASASFPVAVGINAHGMDWTILYNRLKRFGGKVIAGDYCNWDKRLQPLAVLSIKKNFRHFYEGAEEQDHVIRDALIEYLIANPVVVNDFCCFVEQGLPSGIAMTSIFGSVINHNIVVASIFRALLEANRLDLFDPRLWEMTFYGDDHIIALSPELQEYFTFHTLKAFIDEHGMGYTDAAKLGIFNDFDELEDVPYLKRKFKNNKGKIMAPLEMNSIEGMVQWRHKALPDVEHVPAIWDSLSTELVYHGPEEYNRVMTLVWDKYVEWCSLKGTQPQHLLHSYYLAFTKWSSERGL